MIHYFPPAARPPSRGPAYGSMKRQLHGVDAHFPNLNGLLSEDAEGAAGPLDCVCKLSVPKRVRRESSKKPDSLRRAWSEAAGICAGRLKTAAFAMYGPGTPVQTAVMQHAGNVLTITVDYLESWSPNVENKDKVDKLLGMFLVGASPAMTEFDQADSIPRLISEAGGDPVSAVRAGIKLSMHLQFSGALCAMQDVVCAVARRLEEVLPITIPDKVIELVLEYYSEKNILPACRPEGDISRLYRFLAVFMCICGRQGGGLYRCKGSGPSESEISMAVIEALYRQTKHTADLRKTVHAFQTEEVRKVRFKKQAVWFAAQEVRALSVQEMQSYRAHAQSPKPDPKMPLRPAAPTEAETRRMTVYRHFLNWPTAAAVQKEFMTPAEEGRGVELDSLYSDCILIKASGD